MKRREILKTGAILMMVTSLTKNVSAAESTGSSQGGLPVWFKHGVDSVALPDGSWNLWVRPDPRNAKIRFVRLRLQVAEDEEFNSLIAEQIHIARKESSYIVRANFSTKIDQPELYFRFVALDSGLPGKPNELQVSPVGILKPFRES